MNYLFYAASVGLMAYDAHDAFCHHSDEDSSGEKLGDQFQPVIEKHSIRTDIKVEQRYGNRFCGANGQNLCPHLGEASIVSCPSFSRTDEDAYNFVVKHELSHIKHSDHFLLSLSIAVGLVALGTLSGMAFGVMKIALAGLASYLCFSRIPRYTEDRADRFAIENSSVEELKGGIRIFRAFQVFTEKYRSVAKAGSIQFTKEGDSRFDIHHSSFSQRLSVIRAELAKRGESYSNTDAEIDLKFPKLTRLIAKNTQMQVNGFRVQLGEEDKLSKTLGL